jgi:hypothetical protein
MHKSQSSNLISHFRWAHTDKCWADYALSYCVGRVVDGKQATARSHINISGENRAAWPVEGGGNFVDVTLGVVVQQAAGTLMAFQPEYLHGTACLCGAHNRTCTITFSSHIAEAFRIAVEGTKVESGYGAGEGNVTD